MPALHPAHLTRTERAADRGYVDIPDYMIWSGGVVRGDTELHVETEMIISGGDKYVQALAHVINKNKAVWESGNIISSEQGYFYNLGTMQVFDATSFDGKLMYLDSFDGCCPYESEMLYTWG